MLPVINIVGKCLISQSIRTQDSKYITAPFVSQGIINFAYVSFLVSVCLSVLTMSFPALCADSAHPPGMLTCPEVLLSLLKKCGKVFVTLFPRFPPL